MRLYQDDDAYSRYLYSQQRQMGKSTPDEAIAVRPGPVKVSVTVSASFDLK